jgi:hypothetical protein
MVCGSLAAPAAAQGAQLTVDDDRLQCPSAEYTSIAAAVGAALPGDVVSVCDGVYREGGGGAGTSAVTIRKALTLRGAGAGRVFVIPNGTSLRAGGFRDEVGEVISVVDTRADISGLTVFGNGVAVDAGIGFHGSNGSLISVEVVDLVPAAGLGSGDGGIGVVVHHGPPDPPNPLPVPNPLGLLKSVTIRDSLVEGYNQAGIVVDAQKADGTPSLAGLPLRGAFAAIVDSRVTGAGIQDAIAQTGIAFSSGSTGVIVENGVSGNYYAPDRTLSAGIRFDRSVNTDQTRVNLNGLQGNGMGLANAPQTGTYRIDALRNWWGSALGPSAGDALGRGDFVSGTMAGNGGTADRTDSVDFREFLTVPAPLDVPLNEWRDGQPSVALQVDGGTLRATASDDIGLRSVTFMRGNEVLAVDTQAPYETPWTSDGTTQTLLAIAEDSRGQTTTAATAFAAAPQPAPVVEDLAPTLTLSAPGTGRGTFTASVAAADDRGVASVTFLLGTREVCKVTAAPYRCAIAARGSEVGRQTLTAIVADGAGQTATALRAVTIARFTPTSLSHTSRGTRGKLTTSGRLALPAAVSRSEGCDGDLTVTYKRGTRTVATKRIDLRSTCSYSTTQKLTKGAYTVSVQFRGTGVLAPVKAATRKATVR